MNYLLLFLATLTSTAKVVTCKKVGHDSKNSAQTFLSNGVILAVASAVIFCSLLGNLDSVFGISSFSFWLAVLFSVFLLFTQSTEIFAMNFGSVSMTMMVFTCGFLVPIFYGCIFLDEEISIYQIIGLLVLFVALFLIISPKRGEKFSFIWLILTVFATLGSGTNAIIQKVHQASEFKDELMPFLFYSLLFASVLSFGAFLVSNKGFKLPESHGSRLGTAVFLTIGGLCVGVLNVLNLSLAGKLPAVIQFPIYSVGSMILSGLAGRFIWGERMSTRKLIGFAVGCVAITVIAVF